MSLPRELRDEVYKHLLTATYRIDTSPSARYVQALEADGAYNDHTSIYQATPEPLFDFEKPSDRLGILAVNEFIAEEAKEVLYKSSTYVFHIGSGTGLTGREFLNLKAIESMQNVEIYLAFGPIARLDTKSVPTALTTTLELLHILGGDQVNRNTCDIDILWAPDSIETLRLLSPALGRLSGFQHLKIKIQDASDYNRWKNPAGHKQAIQHLVESINPDLGPRLYGWTPSKTFIMKFQPRISKQKGDEMVFVVEKERKKWKQI